MLLPRTPYSALRFCPDIVNIKYNLPFSKAEGTEAQEVCKSPSATARKWQNEAVTGVICPMDGLPCGLSTQWVRESVESVWSVGMQKEGLPDGWTASTASLHM